MSAAITPRCICSDFKRHIDPTYGNCYTFNWDIHKNFTSDKAGPFYGLRLMLFVDADEYLPMNEALGIRIAVHSKSDYPLPDTFGYSAPTGFISSFGLSQKKVLRMPAPYGDCVENEVAKTVDYIYPHHEYSVEASIALCQLRCAGVLPNMLPKERAVQVWLR